MVALTIVGVGAGVVITVATTKLYQASITVFVAPSPSIVSSGSDLSNGNTFVQDRVQSYTRIATVPAVTGPVISQLGLKLTNSELADKITADAPLNKVLINLSVTDTDPATAARIANAVGSAFIAAVENTEQTDAQGKPVVKLTVIQPAAVPSAPVVPRKVLNLGLGLGIGLLVGIGVVFLRDLLDTTVKGPADFAELQIPVLAIVPYDKRAPEAPIALRDDRHGGRSEAYRQLRTNLQFINVDNAPRIIAVTSAMPGEGKTTTALNLAAALADGGFRVALIEADLRRPTVAKALGLVKDVGLTTALVGKSAPEELLQPVARNFVVMTSGAIPPNPSELLLTEQARNIITRIAAAVDYVILDTAPLLPVADGAEVAAIADVTLLVHQAGKTNREQVTRSVEALANVGERPVGVVLNMLSRRRGAGNDYYYYGYRYAPTYRPER